MPAHIIQSTIEEYCSQYNGDPYHAVFYDPPYHLTSITERFGSSTAAVAKDIDGVYKRASTGFMGEIWDGGDTFFQKDVHLAIKELLYPGAFGMAYAASRNWHRLATAIEDAGFIIHPTIFVWLRGKGFPKATNIHVQFERTLCDRGLRCSEPACGALWVPETDDAFCPVCGASGGHGAWIYKDDGTEMVSEAPFRTEEANMWYHHRYGTAALKPLAEPCILFQKPYSGDRALDDLIAHGAGALNIGAARVAGEPWQLGTQTDVTGGGFNTKRPADGHVHAQNVSGGENGRYPGNFAMVHSPGCRLTGFRDADGYTINRFEDGAKPFGDGAGHGWEAHERTNRVPVWECAPGCVVNELNEKTGGPDGAAQYYHQAGWAYELEEQLASASPVTYASRPSQAEADAGLDGDNPHPTLKPIDLGQWLAKLLLPPEGVGERRMLVPCAGTGSEVIGARVAGWDVVDGVEMSEDYCEIAKMRVSYWEDAHYQLPMF